MLYRNYAEALRAHLDGRRPDEAGTDFPTLADGIRGMAFVETVVESARRGLPTGRSGVYGGYQDWVDRPGRFRSLGDGAVDFRGIFSKLAACDFDGWAVLEWECCLKHQEDGAREGAAFIRDHIIRVTDKAFDDFASSGADDAANRRVLGLS